MAEHKFVKLTSEDGLGVWVRPSAVVAVSEIAPDKCRTLGDTKSRVEISADTFIDVLQPPAEVLALLEGGPHQDSDQELFAIMKASLDLQREWIARAREGEQRPDLSGVGDVIEELREIADSPCYDDDARFDDEHGFGPTILGIRRLVSALAPAPKKGM